MTASNDKAREQRHIDGGGKRITARVSGAAYDRLHELAAHYRLCAWEVLDRLLRDEPLGLPHRGNSYQQREGLSNEEIRELDRLGGVQNGE